MYCDLCDTSVKNKSKRSHLRSENHKDLQGFINNRYNIKNPDFLKIEDFLKTYILDHDKRFIYYSVVCK